MPLLLYEVRVLTASNYFLSVHHTDLRKEGIFFYALMSTLTPGCDRRKALR